jgi:hypothetical protein
MYMGLRMLGRQKYTAEPLVSELSACEFEVAVENLKKTSITGYQSNSSRLDKSRG